ncbi:MAG TPA: hypothetical protein VM689_21460 [Aliidongia sp.]|nr:hypothetical protein [Aliidongia sp.]
MKLVAGILRELWGLFFDDELLALGLLAWVALVGFGLPALGLSRIGGPVLFLGAALVLVASVVRAGRRLRK